MRWIQLREHGPAQEVPRLPAQVGRALAPLVSVSDAGSDRSRVTPSSKVGALRAGDVAVHVEPKLDIAHLLFLVDYATRPVSWQEPLAVEDVDAGLAATVADAFAGLATSALSRGVLQGYRPTTTTSPVLRGRAKLTEQFGVQPLPFPFRVSYAEFCPDCAENRVLRAAADRALRLPRLRPETRKRLDGILRKLSGVTAAPTPWHSTRANVPYRDALRVAELILSGSGFGPAAGAVPAYGFVLDLDVVFQDFVCVAIGEALDAEVTGVRRAQFQTFLDSAGEVSIIPDFVFLVDGEPAAVADAKYKDGGKRIPTDLYQMVAYCSALGLRRGHLVYAEGPERPVVLEVRHSGVQVVRHALDLTRPPRLLLSAAGRLAAELARDVRSAPGNSTVLDDRPEEVVHVRVAETP